MKYKRYIYERNYLSPIDRDVEVLNKVAKLVTTRKAHFCWVCRKTFPKNTAMVCERAFVDGKPGSCYTCIDCIDDFIEENEIIAEEGKT